MDTQKRDTLEAIVLDCTMTLLRQIERATDDRGLDEIAARIAKLPELLTPTE